MKRITALLFVIMLLFSLSARASAVTPDLFNDDVARLEKKIPDDVQRQMDEAGADSIADITENGLDTEGILSYLLDLIPQYMNEPFSALLVMLMVLVLASVAEGYTYSLRYTDTKEVMGVAVSLFLATVAVVPVVSLVDAAVSVMKGASDIMLLYLPVMAGILAFSGHAISSAGYYTAVVTVSQLISWLSSVVLAPLLNMFLSLAVSSGICNRLNLSSLTDMLSKTFKWILGFMMSIFIAVIGLNSALSSAADTLTGRAARFTLSSFVPIIGSAVAEAYNTLQGSVNLLRSGVGVFVIVAVIFSFMPLVIRTLLWSCAVNIAKMSAEALSNASGMPMLHALSSFLSSFIAMLICVMTVFVISSAVILRIGGVS